MCGIAGYSGSNQIDLSQILSFLNHRGPDDSGIFDDQYNNIGLVHTRLSILDTSYAGHQPMANEDESVILVFNGEIYNFKKLRDSLVRKGFEFRGKSDTEVLLNLYISEGKEMFSSLNGIYSFAIWDKNENILMIARDPFGVKPLYYSFSDDSFVFSSEIKSLMHLTRTEKSIDYKSLDRYLSFLYCPGSCTPLREIKKVNPGSYMIIKTGKIINQSQFYKLPIFRKKKKKINFREAVEGTRKILKKAVYKQMVSDVPLGAFLSGGLDSSSIVALAKERDPHIKCFTIETDDSMQDGFNSDLPYAKLAANHLDVDLHVIKFDPSNLIKDIEKMVYQLDEPLADPSALNVLYISRLAKKNNIKVLLSGAGGDDIFTGYRRHTAINFEKYWKWLPQFGRLALSNITNSFDQNKAYIRRLSKIFSGASLNEHRNIVNYFLWSQRSDLETLYSEDFKRSLTEESNMDPMLEFISNIDDKYNDLEKMLAIEQRFFLTDHNLTYTDKMAMAEGVEVRVPFLDEDLVDFVNTIPIDLKQNGRKGKWILKKAMEPYLPKRLIYRPKTGFGAPIRKWIKNELKILRDEILSESSIKNRGLFNHLSVYNLIKMNDAGRIDASYTIFSLIIIEIWFRKFVDDGGITLCK
tara:strand:+ start:1566 stop:3479 length:1914 start_codon:yes stop_codon:yes gene_type:complete